MKKISTKALKLLYKRKNKIGKLPSFTIQESSENILKGKIEIIKFNENDYQQILFNEPIIIEKLREEIKTIDKNYKYIINIDMIPNYEIIDLIKKHIINIDDFIAEDLMNTDQRVKYESRGNFVFIVLKTPVEYDFSKIIKKEVPKIYEQISIIFSQNIIIVFQEGIEGDQLDKLRKNISFLKNNSIEFFLYYIIDLTVDKYLAFIEELEDYLKELEKKLFNESNLDTGMIYYIRINLGIIKRDFINLLEVVKTLKFSAFNKLPEFQIDDLLDHIYKTVEIVNDLNQFVSFLFETYLSVLNTKFNESMKILTVINTMFVPPIFIAGIYGMNFENMPELKWKYGYFFALFIMFSIMFFLFIYFKKKKYL